MAGNIDFKPAFQAEKIHGNFTRMVMHIEEDVRNIGPLGNKQVITRKLVPKREEFKEGYMVYFPQGHSMFVAADDEVELHRPEAECPGSLERVCAHRACYAAPGSGRRDDIAAIRDMGAASLIVRAQIIGPRDRAARFGNMHLVRR